MRERDKRLTVPDRHPYIAIDNVPGHEGTHHMRAPSPIVADRLSGLQRRDDTRLAATGAIVGLSWAHRDVELDAGQPQAADMTDPELIVYGRQVVEELHAEGYTFNALTLIAGAVWHHTTVSMRLTDEVKERLDFFGRQRGDSDSPPSTATSDSSGDESAPSPD
jgi:hypothetical protein